MKERPILFTGEMVREILAGRKTQTRRPVKNLRVRLRHEVTSDLPVGVRATRGARAGTYPATMNPHGAVSVRTAGDELLGVKPQEFDFLCPYADGHTYLRKFPDGRAVWHLQVPPGEQRLWVRETWGIFSTDTGSVSVGYAARLPPGKTLVDTDGGVDVIRVPREAWTWADQRVDPDRWRPGIHMPRWACRLVLEVESVRLERLHAITEEDARAEGMEFLLEGSRDATPRDTFLRRWDAMYGGGDFARAANRWVWVVTFRRADAARSAA